MHRHVFSTINHMASKSHIKIIPGTLWPYHVDPRAVIHIDHIYL